MKKQERPTTTFNIQSILLSSNLIKLLPYASVRDELCLHPLQQKSCKYPQFFEHFRTLHVQRNPHHSHPCFLGVLTFSTTLYLRGWPIQMQSCSPKPFYTAWQHTIFVWEPSSTSNNRRAPPSKIILTPLLRDQSWRTQLLNASKSRAGSRKSTHVLIG